MTGVQTCALPIWEADAVYVIGLLNTGPPPETACDDSHIFGSGARADINPDKNSLKLFSKTGGLFFEYDDNTGACRVESPSGDIAFTAPHGSIDFTAAKGVRFFSALALEFKSLHSIRMAVSDLLKNSISALDLGPGHIGAKGDQVDIHAGNANITMDNTRFSGGRFAGKIGDIRLVVDRVETVAGDIVQKAANIYHTVENLVQTNTRRLRTLVTETCHIKSRKLFVKAGEDVKIKGEKIHLG